MTRKDYNRAYYLANRKKLLASENRRHWENRDHRLAYMNAAYAADKPARLETQKAYYASHKLERLAWDRKYLTSVKGTARALIAGARARAKKRGLRCSLDRARIEAVLTTGRCEATGLHFDLQRVTKVKRSASRAPSLDKLDPHGDYVDANVQVLSLIHI